MWKAPASAPKFPETLGFHQKGIFSPEVCKASNPTLKSVSRGVKSIFEDLFSCWVIPVMTFRWGLQNSYKCLLPLGYPGTVYQHKYCQKRAERERNNPVTAVWQMLIFQQGKETYLKEEQGRRSMECDPPSAGKKEASACHNPLVQQYPIAPDLQACCQPSHWRNSYRTWNAETYAMGQKLEEGPLPVGQKIHCVYPRAKRSDSSSQLTWLMLVSCEPLSDRISTQHQHPPHHLAVLNRCLAAASPSPSCTQINERVIFLLISSMSFPQPFPLYSSPCAFHLCSKPQIYPWEWGRTTHVSVTVPKPCTQHLCWSRGHYTQVCSLPLWKHKMKYLRTAVRIACLGTKTHCQKWLLHP